MPEETRMGGVFLSMEMGYDEIVEALQEYAKARQEEDSTFNLIVCTGGKETFHTCFYSGASFALNHYLDLSGDKLPAMIQGFKDEVVMETLTMAKEGKLQEYVEKAKESE